MPRSCRTTWTRWLVQQAPGLLASAIFVWSDGAVAIPVGPGNSDKVRQTVALRCQLNGGSWQPCLMHVQELGRTWWIEMGQAKIHFRHEGYGTVAMRYRDGQWKEVQSQWATERTTTKSVLCWEDLCILGPLPLD